MDAQKLSQLDPKLREAYQRVMGTVIPEPAAPGQTPTPPPADAPNIPTPVPTPTPQQPVPPVADPQPTTNPQPTPEPTAPPQPASNFVQMNSAVEAAPTLNSPNFAAPAAPVQNTVVLKKKNTLMPLLFGIAGLVFIAIYTLFWAKIFNLKLPFLQ